MMGALAARVSKKGYDPAERSARTKKAWLKRKRAAKVETTSVEVTPETSTYAGKWAPEFQSGVTPDAFVAARDQTTRSAFLSPLTPDDLRSGQTLLLSKDGRVGGVLQPDGDMGNLFNNGGPKGAATEVLLSMMEQGGRTADCFDGYLPELYANFGLVEVGRMKFNREFAPPNWDYAKDKEPDVIFLARTTDAGRASDIRARVQGDRREWTPVEPTTNYFDDYDAARRAATDIANTRRASLAGSLHENERNRLRGAVRRLAHRASEGNRRSLAASLPEDASKYFTIDADTTMVPTSKLRTTRARAKGIRDAAGFMMEARAGTAERRKPISLRREADGTYTVLDGNSTTAVARRAGWKAIPGHVEKRLAALWVLLSKKYDPAERSARTKKAWLKRKRAVTPTHDSVVGALDEIIDNGFLSVRVENHPVTIQLASMVAPVLAEMKQRGYKMPDAVSIERGSGPRGALTHDFEIPGRPHLTLRVVFPKTTPPDADLDDMVWAAFGGKTPEGHDRFAVRTVRDVVIHEMGHVADAHASSERSTYRRADNVWVDGRGVSVLQLPAKTAARKVSAYAATKPTEFIAEAFLRQYRGETLPPESLALYASMKGPKVRR